MASAKLTYDDSFYRSYRLIEGMKDPETAKKIRKEYSRLRAIANKRLTRLEEAGEPFSSSAAVRYNKGLYAPIKDLSDREIALRLFDVKKFISAKSSSISGQKAIRKELISSLHERFGFVNDRNLEDFGAFMDEARRTLGIKTGMEWDSDAAVELYEIDNDGFNWRDLFDAYDSDGETAEDVFNWWVKNREAAKKELKKAVKTGKPLSAKEVRSAVKKRGVAK